MQQEDKEIHWSIVVAYFVSVIVSIWFSNVFYVLGIEDIRVMVCILFSPIFFISLCEFKNSMATWGCVHILVGIGLHPSVWFRMENIILIREQIKAMYMLDSANSENLHILANIALNLSKSLQADILFRLKLTRPLLFWLYPLSFVLVFWGALMIYQAIKEGGKKYKNQPSNDQ